MSERERQKLLDAFRPDQAAAMLQFVQGLPATVTSIVVHCEGGYSRSSAMCAGWLSSTAIKASRRTLNQQTHRCWRCWYLITGRTENESSMGHGSWSLYVGAEAIHINENKNGSVGGFMSNEDWRQLDPEILSKMIPVTDGFVTWVDWHAAIKELPLLESVFWNWENGITLSHDGIPDRDWYRFLARLRQARAVAPSENG